MNAEESAILGRMIRAIEKEPNRTHFVFVKQTNWDSQVYRIDPGQQAALIQLKELLVEGEGRPAEAPEPAKPAQAKERPGERPLAPV